MTADGGRPDPVVRIYRDPWPHTCPPEVLYGIGMTAAARAEALLRSWIGSGHVPEEYDSFGAVILDPTAPRSVTIPAELVLMTITLGPNGRRYLTEALGTAEPFDRHMLDHTDIVDRYPHLLSDDDAAVAGSAEYKHAIAGGGGLEPVSNSQLALEILRGVTDQVGAQIEGWHANRRAADPYHQWSTPDNEVPAPMAALGDLRILWPPRHVRVAAAGS